MAKQPAAMDPVHIARSKIATSIRMGNPEGEVEGRHMLAEAKLERAALLALECEHPPRHAAVVRICALLHAGVA